MICYPNILEKELTALDGEICRIVALYWNNLTRKCSAKVVCAQTDVPRKTSNEAEKDHLEKYFRFCTKNNKIVATEQVNAEQSAEIFAGQEVFDTNGKRLGNVEKVELTGKGELLTLTVAGKILRKNKVWSVGDVLMIKEKSARQCEAENKRKLAQNARQSEKPSASKTTERAKGVSVVAPVALPNGQTEELSFTVGNIRRRYGDFCFLIGRTADKNIVNFQGELMIKCGERITKEILRQAKIFGKLIELYLHSV